jgi:hypothetical protein
VFRTGVVKSGIHRHSGKSSTSFTAPSEKGTYYITQAISLDYDYVSGTHPNTFENSLAVLRVQTPVTVVARRLAWAEVCNARLSADSGAAALPMELIEQIGLTLEWPFVAGLMSEERQQAEIKQSTAHYYSTGGGGGGGGDDGGGAEGGGDAADGSKCEMM